MMEDEYYKNTKGKEAQVILQKFIKNNPQIKTAIDLGCGSGNDTRFLAKNNIKVTAIDISDVSEFLYEDLKEEEKKRISFIQGRFSNVDLPKADLIISFAALPFVKKELLPKIIKKIYCALNEDGYLICNFFGKKDSWYGYEKHTFIEKDEIEDLLKEFKILKMNEIERDGETGTHEKKHWNIFWIIAKKCLGGRDCEKNNRISTCG